MENDNEVPSRVSISADEYFLYKTEKLRAEIREEINKKSKTTPLIWVGAIIAATTLSFAYFYVNSGYEMEKQLLNMERTRAQFDESEYLLKKTLQKLELSTRESENLVEEIQLLKKEVLTLKLRVEKLELVAGNEKAFQTKEGQP